MELDQRIFRWLWNRGRALRRTRPLWPPADPGPRLPALQKLAGLLCGEPVLLEAAAQGPGGRQGNRLLLPIGHVISGDEEENLDFFRMRLTLMACTPASAADERKAHRVALRRALHEFPGARALYRRVKTIIRQQERLDAARPPRARRDLRALLCGRIYENAHTITLSAIAEAPPELKPQSAEGPAQQIEIAEASQLTEAKRKEIEDYTLGHNFEKIETVDDFDGRWRDLDGDEELHEHSEALQEVKLAWRIRSAEQAQSAVSADVAPGGGGDAADAGEAATAYLYDEWDFRRRQYRKDHCRLFERRLSASSPGFAARIVQERRRTLERLERRFAAAFQELQAVQRQCSGDEPDLDAVTNYFCDLAAGRTPEDRLYIARRKRRKDLSLLFLMDLSMSTDAWTLNRRVLDIEREALALFGETLDRHGCRFAAAGFFSRTRNDCEYLMIKSFAESWHQTRDRLGALSPEGYTRIGPALRRSIELLRQETSARRWIVLFTDGRPNDYDRYEGRYGNLDVRQARREAEAAGIQLQAFAIDARGRPGFTEMLGAGGFSILREPEHLPDSLGDFYLRLLRA